MNLLGRFQFFPTLLIDFSSDYVKESLQKRKLVEG